MPFLALLVLQGGWKPYTLGGFVFQLPTPPVEQKAPGMPKGSRFWISMHNGRNVIAVGIAPIPPGGVQNPDAALAGMIAADLRATASTLVAQSDAAFSGWPAVDFKCRTPEGLIILSRSVVVGDKLVQIGVTGQSEAAVKAPYDKALVHFSLPAGAANGPLTVPGPTFVRRKLMESPASTEMPGLPHEESAPVNDKPGAMVVHRQTSTYGNRIYLAAYGDVPEDKLPKEEEIPNILQALNDDVIRGLKAKAMPSVDTKLDGAYAIRTVASLGANGVAIVVSSLRDGRLYSLVAVVPTPWKDHPEPKRFFDSFRAVGA